MSTSRSEILEIYRLRIRRFEFISPKESNSISNELQKFIVLDEKTQIDQASTFRDLLLRTYNDLSIPKKYINDLHFKQIIHDLLLYFSEKFPINKIDSETGLCIDQATLKVIDPSDCFYSITGAAFSIDALIEFNKSREVIRNRYLMNPFTKYPMLESDIERFIFIAGHKKKDLQFLEESQADEKSLNKGLSSMMSYHDIYKLSIGTSINVTTYPTDFLNFTPLSALGLALIANECNEHRIYGCLYNIKESEINSLLATPEKIPAMIELDAASVQSFVYIASQVNDHKTLKKLCDLAHAEEHPLQIQYSKMKYTCLHIASQTGSLESLKILIQSKYKFDINMQDGYGQTAALIAGKNNHIKIVQLLAKSKANLMIPKSDGIALIHITAQQNNKDLLNLLVSHKVNLSQKSGLSTYERTALHMASKNNSKDIAEILMNNHANIHALDTQGFTPIHMAAYHNSSEVMEIFLKHKDRFDINHCIQNNKCSLSAAGIAAQKNHVNILTLLSESKANLSMKMGPDEFTALHYAVQFNHSESVEFLINLNPTNIFLINKKGQSPFSIACEKSNWHIAKLFLNKTGDIPEMDKALMKKFSIELGTTSSSLFLSLFETAKAESSSNVQNVSAKFINK